jgi:hypothetical protein
MILTNKVNFQCGIDSKEKLKIHGRARITVNR